MLVFSSSHYQKRVNATSDFPVHNLSTGLNYSSIQEAIDANETLNGQTIYVEQGMYQPATVTKSLTIIGENKTNTVIIGFDGIRYQQAIIIESVTNVTISGFTFQSGNDEIVLVFYATNVTVSDNLFTKVHDGIRIEGSTNVTVKNNEFIGNYLWSIRVFGSTNTLIEQNNVTGSNFGVEMRASYSTLTGNFIADSYGKLGLWLWSSPNCILRNNSLRNNGDDLVVSGDTGSYTDYFEDIDNSNTLNGKPMYYVVWQSDFVVPSDAGYVTMICCTNATVRNLTLENQENGIMLLDTMSSRIENVTVSNTQCGILMSTVSCPYSSGIESWSWGGGNVIVGNTLINNDYGIAITCSSNNVIYHNNFVGNYEDTSISRSINVWDDGYPSGGNYWSNYNGTDSNNDGIGDTPYIIDQNNTDNYPLVGISSDFSTPDNSVQTICNSTISNFCFNGTAISFNVSGENGTDGFCRIHVPTALLNATYKVYVNGTEVPYYLLPSSNDTQSYLYFTYHHSTQEVVIIPESLLFPVLPLVMIATLFATIAYGKKHKSGQMPSKSLT